MEASMQIFSLFSSVFVGGIVVKYVTAGDCKAVCEIYVSLSQYSAYCETGKKKQTQIVYEMNNLYFRCFALHTIILFSELHY